MKISVIIPVYNVEKFLAQCLENVVRQTCKNLEIIVVDDGSPDGSRKIYEKYAARDERIKIIRQKNAGLSAARNAGIDAATGDWIHFMDPDDYLNLEYYEKMLAAAAIAPDADIVAGGLYNQYFARSFEYERVVALTTAAEMFKTLLVSTGKSYSVAYLYRRGFLNENKIRFIVGMFIEDMPFMCDVLGAAKLAVTAPGPMYYYVYNEDSITRSRDEARRKKVDRDAVFAKKYRRDFMSARGIADPESGFETISYKLFGWSILRIRRFANGISKYWLFGVKVPFKRRCAVRPAGMK